MHLARRAALAAAFGLSCVVLSQPAGAQSDQDKASARALATQGGTALSEKRYAEALDLTTRAEALYHAPTHLLIIARAAAQLGKVVVAQEAYMKIIRERLAPTAPDAFKDAQVAAQRELPAVEQRIANVKVILTGADGKKIAVTIDGQPLSEALVGVYRPTDPGHHQLVASGNAGPVAEAIVDLGPGERKDVTLVIPPGAAADGVAPANGRFFTPLRIAGIAVGAAGVAGLVIGAISLPGYLDKHGQANDLFNAKNCGVAGNTTCTSAVHTQLETLDNDATPKGTLAAVGFIAGGALVGTGVVLFILGKPAAAPPPPTATTWTPYFDGKTGGFAGTF